jgi:hypothetical protein
VRVRGPPDLPLLQHRPGVCRLGVSVAVACVCPCPSPYPPSRSLWQPPLELLRQWVDYGGWYDRAKQSWKYIVDLQLVCAMAPPGGGRSEISQRLATRFHNINFTFPDDNQIRSIFVSLLSPKLAEFEDEVRRSVLWLRLLVCLRDVCCVPCAACRVLRARSPPARG